MNVSSWDGTLSQNDFPVVARAFAEKWRRIDRTISLWLWIDSRKLPHMVSQSEGFLSMENVPFLRLSVDNEASATGVEETGFPEEEEPLDDATLLVHGDHNEPHYYDYHVVYSASYRVPVLYFRGYCKDGRPLPLNEIEMDLPVSSAKALLESKWTFITQEEHPYLNRPWYKLHPCGTGEWMKLLFRGKAASPEKKVDPELYFVAWFSVVGQVIGLKLPLQMV